MSTKNKGDTSNTIALNKKARHDYFIEDRFEAGLVLEGWEVKSLRAGRANLTESYVIVKNGAAWLLGATITALPTATTHNHPDATHTQKQQQHHKEQDKHNNTEKHKDNTHNTHTLFWK